MLTTPMGSSGAWDRVVCAGCAGLTPTLCVENRVIEDTNSSTRCTVLRGEGSTASTGSRCGNPGLSYGWSTSRPLRLLSGPVRPFDVRCVKSNTANERTDRGSDGLLASIQSPFAPLDSTERTPNANAGIEDQIVGSADTTSSPRRGAEPMTAKQCTACSETKPLEQFRRLKPRKPGWADRHSWCITCEREAARLRAAKRYRDDPEWRAKQLVNATSPWPTRSAPQRWRRGWRFGAPTSVRPARSTGVATSRAGPSVGPRSALWATEIVGSPRLAMRCRAERAGVASQID
jgi:hypothetical protein